MEILLQQPLVLAVWGGWIFDDQSERSGAIEVLASVQPSVLAKLLAKSGGGHQGVQQKDGEKGFKGKRLN